MINWIKITDETPEEGKRLLYFFEGIGVWTGFYYGRDESYPDSNNHTFGFKTFTAFIKIGNPSLESFKPSCLPPTLKGWQGGPPMTTSQ